MENQENFRIGEVIRALARKRGGRSVAAGLWGVSERTLASYMSGESDPKLSFLIAVAEKESISLASFFENSANICTPPESGSIHIPLRDVYASAGPGAEVFDEAPKDFLSFSRHFVEAWGRSHTHVEAIRVIGDSMEPTIMNGAIVLIDRADRTLVEGRIYAFRTPDGLRLKRFQRAIDGAVLLVSDNDIYAPERIAAEDMNELRVAGRVFWTERHV